MVAEAQAVRERVLRDLAVRRKRARQQVEKLNAGRERLLEAYDVVRRTVGEATDELTTSLADARLAADAAARRIDEEPEPTLEQLDEEVANAGLVDLPIAEVEHAHDHDDEEGHGPFSGEVPAVPTSEASAPAAPAPDEPARPVELDERRSRKRRRRGSFEGLPPGELTVVQPPSEDEGVRILAEPANREAEADAESAATDTGEPAAVAAAPADARAEEPAGDEVETTEASPAPDDAAAEGAPVDEPAAEAPAVDAEATTDASGAAAAPAAEDVDHSDAAGAGSTADDLFARLRAEQVDEGEPAAEAPAGAAEEVPDEHEANQAEETGRDDGPGPVDEANRPFAARRAALTAVEKELSRRMKRGLADEQNEVLDLLRRAKPTGVDDLLPAVDEHAARWAEAVTASLVDAAAAGADWSGGKPSSVADLADELARGLTLPLRERIDRSFSASDGNLDDVADRVRALYREWKGQRLGETTAHFIAAAYARGVFDGVAAGAMVHWVVDPSAGPCPDCDDNVLAGAIAKGSEFPTGNPCAPAHPGCHCLVLAVDG